MEELDMMLHNVKDSYNSFVFAVITYAKKKNTRLNAVKNYIRENPTALSSDILEFISKQEDFYEDTIYVNAQAS